jgi:hypothetical protein
MYSNGPASKILELPELYREGIEKSNQWKRERTRPDDDMTTACWSCTFPDDPCEDGTFTIKVGNKFLSDLNQRLEMIFAIWEWQSKPISW